MAKRIIMTGGGIVSSKRADYISKGKANAEDLNERKLFSADEKEINRLQATNHLGFGDIPAEGEISELIFSLERKDFTRLGTTLDEQKDALREIVQEGLENLWKELNVKDVRYIAGIHLNTNNPHVHIAFSRKAYDLETNELRNMPKIPRSWFWRENGENSKLAKLFESSLASHTLATPPGSIRTKAGKNIFLPRKEFDESRIEKTLNRLSSINHISPHWVEHLTNNESLYVSRQGALVFMRRDSVGNTTGYVYETSFQADDTKGFFYIGDPNSASNFIIVDNPKQSLAALELVGHRDLSDVCIIASDNGKTPIALTDILHSKSQEKNLRIIWALGRDRNGFQEQEAYQDLQIALTENRSDDAPTLEFYSWIPKEGFGRNWSDQLQFRNLPGELGAVVKKVLITDTVYADALDKRITEEYEAKVADVFKNIIIENNNDEFIVYEKTIEGKGIEMGRYRQTAEERSAGNFYLTSIKNENLDEEVFTDELDIISKIEETFGAKIEQEFLAAEAAVNYVDTRNLNEESLNAVKSETIVKDSNVKRKLSFKEETEILKNIPLEDVLPELGLHLTWDTDRREFVYRDTQKLHKIKVHGDLWCDRYDDNRGGRNPINLVMHVTGNSFAEAREFLHLTFGTEYIPTENETKVLLKQDSETKPKQIFIMPEPNENNLSSAMNYLTQERALSFGVVNEMVERGFIFANSYGSVVFVNKDESGNVKGAAWRATKGTKRGDYPGTDKTNAWFHIGNISTASKFIVTEAPIEAMSYYQFHKDSLNLEDTAIISVGTNSVPISLVNLLEKNAGENGELVVAFNNDKRGQDGIHFLLEKIGRYVLLKHKTQFINDLIDTTPFTGKVTLDVPHLEDWNDDLKAAQEVEFSAGDTEHIAAEIENLSRPDILENAEITATLTSLKINSIKDTTISEIEITNPVNFNSISDFDNYIKNVSNQTTKAIIEIDLMLSNETNYSVDFRIEEIKDLSLKGIINEQINVIGIARKEESDKSLLTEYTDQISGLKYILNAVGKIQETEIADEIIESETKSDDKYETDLITSVKLSVPLHLQEFGKAEILLARDNPNDTRFHVGYRLKVGDSIYESLPDRRQPSFPQGKQALSIGHELLLNKIRSHWEKLGSPKFPMSEMASDLSEDKFTAYLLNKAERRAREFYNNSFEPSFSIEASLSKAEITMLRRWRERTNSEEFYKPENVFAGAAIDNKPSRNLMYKLIYQGFVETRIEDTAIRVRGFQPLIPRIVSKLDDRVLDEITKSSLTVQKEILEKNISDLKLKLEKDNSPSSKFLLSNELEIAEKRLLKFEKDNDTNAENTLKTENTSNSEIEPDVQEIKLGEDPGKDYALLAENKLKGYYDFKAHQIHIAFQEAYALNYQLIAGFSFKYKTSIVTLLSSDRENGLQLNFRSENNNGKGRNQNYLLNKLIDEDILSKETFVRLIQVSRAAEELRTELENSNLHTKYSATYSPDTILPDADGFRIPSKYSEGDYILFKNRDTGEITFSKFIISEKVHSFDTAEQKKFASIAEALQHLQERETYFSNKPVIQLGDAFQKPNSSDKAIYVYKDINSEGQILIINTSISANDEASLKTFSRNEFEREFGMMINNNSSFSTTQSRSKEIAHFYNKIENESAISELFADDKDFSAELKTFNESFIKHETGRYLFQADLGLPKEINLSSIDVIGYNRDASVIIYRLEKDWNIAFLRPENENYSHSKISDISNHQSIIDEFIFHTKAADGIEQHLELKEISHTQNFPEVWEMPLEEFTGLVRSGKFNFEMKDTTSKSNISLLLKALETAQNNRDRTNERSFDKQIKEEIAIYYQTQIEDAVKQGKSVANEVLQDYPQFAALSLEKDINAEFSTQQYNVSVGLKQTASSGEYDVFFNDDTLQTHNYPQYRIYAPEEGFEEWVILKNNYDPKTNPRVYDFELSELSYENKKDFVAATIKKITSEHKIRSNKPTVLASAEQEGRIEKRIAKLLHAHKIADQIAGSQDFYVRLENSPYMDLHITKDYDTNLIRLTHYYEQNGDLMHDGEMNFRLSKNGKLSLNETAAAIYGTPRYGYDRTFAEMFSKNLINQGFEKANLVRAFDEVEQNDNSLEKTVDQFSDNQNSVEVENIEESVEQIKESAIETIYLEQKEFAKKYAASKDAYDRVHEFAEFLKKNYPELGFAAGYIGNDTPQYDDREYKLFTDIARKGMWRDNEPAKFGSSSSWEKLADNIFNGDDFEKFLDDRIKDKNIYNGETINQALVRLKKEGTNVVERFFASKQGETVHTQIEREVFFEQYKDAFSNEKTQNIIRTVGDISDNRTPFVADLMEQIGDLEGFDLSRAVKNGFVSVENKNLTAEEQNIALTENGKIIFDYLKTGKINSDWKMDAQIFGLLYKTKETQMLLDKHFASEGLKNPWTVKPDFEMDILEIGILNTLRPEFFDGYPQFSLMEVDSKERTWQIAEGVHTPATREEPDDFQYVELEKKQFEYEGAIQHLFYDELMPITNLSANRVANEYRYPLALETEPMGVKKGTISLALDVREMLHEGKSIGNNVAFNKLAETHFGGTRAAGSFDARDAYDALELGVNLYLLDNGRKFVARSPEITLREVRELIKRLPTQTDRTEEQQLFQQFSTVPTESFVAFAATGMRFDDILLEPSAGTGTLAVFGKMLGLETHVNEISDRRSGILRIIGFHSVSRQDAQFLNDTLDQNIKPTLILMNPPFSATGGRTKNRTIYGAEHISDALLRLAPGGRLVAIASEGMSFEKPTFTNWWANMMGKYNVRANISVPGDEYAKYGTTFGNQLIVIDKTGATPGANLAEQFNSVLSGKYANLEEILSIVNKLGDDRRAPEDFVKNERNLSGVEKVTVEKDISVVISEFKNISSKDLLDYYSDETRFEFKTITGIVERINLIPAKNGSDDLFLQTRVRTDEGFIYRFNIGNREIDVAAKELFETIKSGTIKSGDAFRFDGYIYRDLEERAINFKKKSPETFDKGEGKTIPAHAINVYHLENEQSKIIEQITNNLPELYEKARWDAIGAITGERVERIENRGYRIIYGNVEPKSDLYYEIAGIIGPGAEPFVGKNLTIEKVKFSNIETSENITRADIKNNPQKVYLFGDNLKKSGYGGQAKEMRGEPNSIGIPTKKAPSNESWAFFNDADYEDNKTAIDRAFAKLAKYAPETEIVIPQAGLGTGLADLESKAPKTYAYLQERLEKAGFPKTEREQLRTENIEAQNNDETSSFSNSAKSIPEIDLTAYQKASFEDGNYIEDEENYSPEEVRAQYFNETYALAESVLQLSKDVKAKPTTNKQVREHKKLTEKLRDDTINLSGHVYETGRYFGENSEEFLKQELFARGIEFDEEYKVILNENKQNENENKQNTSKTGLGRNNSDSGGDAGFQFSLFETTDNFDESFIGRNELREPSDNDDERSESVSINKNALDNKSDASLSSADTGIELSDNLAAEDGNNRNFPTGTGTVERDSGKRLNEKGSHLETDNSPQTIRQKAEGKANLLLPEVFDLTPTQVEVYKKENINLSEIGFDTLLLSSKAVAIRTIPNNLNVSEGKELFVELINNPEIIQEYFISKADSILQNDIAEKIEEIENLLNVGKNQERGKRLDNLGVVEYKPAKLQGGVDHPGDIVESASMSAVQPPDIKYTPQLSKEIIETGKLSSLQLEAVIYAGQRHEHRLPNGMRAGVFIGDGTGVGKGRELAGITLDNWNQGRKRILWLSINYDLVPSTDRDLKDLGAVGVPLSSLDRHKLAADLNEAVGDAVLFSSYSTLIGKGKDGKTRFEQIVNWLGEDGVILFDEGHLAKNAVSFGIQEASQRGETVVELQIGAKSNPNWRFVYSSATGATELRNMAYMQRLGLWGEGTGFPGGFAEFHNTIDKGGIGAMEMVARDMKAAGMYMSRSLSFRGVDYRQVHHELTPEQIEIYNLSSRAWSSVVVQFDNAIRETNANSRARAMAFARLWAGEQMFYRQLMTALKVPAVIRETERILSEGSEFTNAATGAKTVIPAQVVIGVIGTGEARTKDQVSKAMQMGLDLESLDFSPKQILLNVVESGFPVKRYTEKLDPTSGNLVKVPVLDENGRHLESQEALMMRDLLLTELNEKVVLPDNPLDQIVNYFGENTVAEITGRKRRIIIDPETGMRNYVKRAREGVAMDKASQDEMNAFQSGRKRVGIISQSASTGISLHSELKPLLANYVATGRMTTQQADNILAFWNEQKDAEGVIALVDETGNEVLRRVHITLETSWSADVQMQTFGRTHRSNQLFPPEYVLMSTDLGGEKRFLSTIAKRLGSLGALTKGDREQAGGGNLLQYDFENKYGLEAAKKIVTMLRDEKASLMTLLPLDPQTGEERSGLRLLYTIGLAKLKDGSLTVTEETLTNLEVSRFLNRVLMLDVETQNTVFNAFVAEMEYIIQKDKELGLFDEGVRDIEGENIRFAEEPRIVSTDNATGADTLYYQIHADTPTSPTTLEEISNRNQVTRINGIEVSQNKEQGIFYQQINSKNIIYAEFLNSRVEPATGSMRKFYKFARPSGWQSNLLAEDELLQKYVPVRLDQIKDFGTKEVPQNEKVSDWWNRAVKDTPKTQVQNYHLIAGAVLPVWQRLSSSNESGNQMSLKTVRIETETGERIVGVQIPSGQINRVLRDLGVERSFKSPEEIFDAVIETKDKIELVGGIRLHPTFLKGQAVIQILNASVYQQEEFKKYGALPEFLSFEKKFFIPSEKEKGVEVLSKILERYPAVDSANKSDSTEPSLTAPKMGKDNRQNALDETIDKFKTNMKIAVAEKLENVQKILGDKIPHEISRFIDDTTFDNNLQRPTEEFAAKTTFKAAKRGIEANGAGMSLLNQWMQTYNQQEKSSFPETSVKGLTMPREMLLDFAEFVRVETTNYSVDGKAPTPAMTASLEFVKTVDKLSQMNEFTERDFTAVYMPSTKSHEVFHISTREGGFLYSDEDLDKLAEHPAHLAFLKSSGKYREYYLGEINKNSDVEKEITPLMEKQIIAATTEETAAWIWGGDRKEIGISRTDAADYMRQWMTVFVKYNGAEKLDDFEKAASYTIQKVFNEVKKQSVSDKMSETLNETISGENYEKRTNQGKHNGQRERGENSFIERTVSANSKYDGEGEKREDRSDSRNKREEKSAEIRIDNNDDLLEMPEIVLSFSEDLSNEIKINQIIENKDLEDKLEPMQIQENSEAAEISIKDSKLMEIEPEVGEITKSDGEIDTEKKIGEQLGKEILAKAELNEAKFRLSQFIKEGDNTEFCIEAEIDGQPEIRRTSVAELKLEAKSIATAEIESDKKIGILEMEAENENLSLEEVSRIRFEKTVERVELSQLPWHQAIEQSRNRLENKMQSNVEELEIKASLIQEETESLFEKAGSPKDVKAVIKPEILWEEQIKAAQRGDVEIFTELEQIHRTSGIMRSDDAFARLRGVELLTDLDARVEDKKLLDFHDNKSSEKVVVELSKDGKDIKVENLKILDAVAAHESLSTESKVAKEQADQERATARREAFQPIRHMIDPLSPINGKLAWITKPMQTLNAHANPIEIVRNNPGIQIIRATWNYLEHSGNARALEKIAAEANLQAKAVKAKFASEDWEKANDVANIVKDSVKVENDLRSKLNETVDAKEKSFEMPDRALSDSEMKKVGEIAAKMGDTNLLKKYHALVEQDSALAEEVGLETETFASKTILTEIQGARVGLNAIENIAVNAEGAIEITLSASQLVEAKNIMEASDAAQEFQKRIVGENMIPRLSMQDASEAQELMSSVYDPQIDDYINNQIAQNGNNLIDQIQTPLNTTELNSLAQMSLPQNVFERFEQINQSNQILDELTKQGNLASQMNIPFQNVGQNFTTVNQSSITERQAQEFWEKDRQMREMQNANKIKTNQSIQAQEAMETAELTEAANLIEAEESMEAGAILAI